MGELKDSSQTQKILVRKKTREVNQVGGDVGACSVLKAEREDHFQNGESIRAVMVVEESQVG